jgi:hypothetical protein
VRVSEEAIGVTDEDPEQARSRPFILFWGATAGAVLFLGAAWSTASRVFGPAGTALDVLVLVLALLGLAGALLIAGRIALVTGRVRRRARRQ